MLALQDRGYADAEPSALCRSRRRIFTAIASGCASASATPAPRRLPTTRLLELLLFRAIPRRDTKPLAKALIEQLRLVRRGAFGAAASACRRSRASATPPSPTSRSSQAAAQRLRAGRVQQRPVLSSWARCSTIAAPPWPSRSKEQFRILFLDKKNQLIADEVQQTGTVDHTPVYPREVVKRALELSATAHHPGAQPSLGRSDAVARRHRDDAGRSSSVPSRSASRPRPHHRRQEGPRQPEGTEADLSIRLHAQVGCRRCRPSDVIPR